MQSRCFTDCISKTSPCRIIISHITILPTHRPSYKDDIVTLC
jgi:hypothetical protein